MYKQLKIPIIKKHMPALVAQHIEGMVNPFEPIRNPFFIPSTHNETVPEGVVVVDIKWICWNIQDWLEEQNPSKWRRGEHRDLNIYVRYVVSEDLYTLLALKWL